MPAVGDEKGLEDVRHCVATLEKLINNGAEMEKLPRELRESLMGAAGRLAHPGRDQLRLRNKEIRKARKTRIIKQDRAARDTTEIRRARTHAVYSAPLQIIGEAQHEAAQLKNPRNCYVCKKEFLKVHFFYDSMCGDCGDFNYQKRFQTVSLAGQTAVITGARLKIGYHSALMMLRAGAQVIVTTRFPVDAAARFAREKDFAEWKDRISVFGLDLRHTPSVELFTNFLNQSLERLDILINNAAQTVRRPPGFYAHLMAAEEAPLTPETASILGSFETCKKLIPAGDGAGLMSSAKLSQIPFSYDRALSPDNVFPKGRLDADLQQVDLRATNSWRMTLADVPTPEMLEVQLVNSVAPFVLCSRLAPLMRRDNTNKKHIVNVSAMEGKFNRFTKTDKHPHTNMAKAALNMLTLTSAPDLARDGIYMNAVDTGWVTDEDPAAISARKQQIHDFHPPLDIVDGAARVCDPFFSGIATNQHYVGKFLKDFFPTEW